MSSVAARANAAISFVKPGVVGVLLFEWNK